VFLPREIKIREKYSCIYARKHNSKINVKMQVMIISIKPIIMQKKLENYLCNFSKLMIYRIFLTACYTSGEK